jgi:hypothetical protein
MNIWLDNLNKYTNIIEKVSERALIKTILMIFNFVSQKWYKIEC